MMRKVGGKPAQGQKLDGEIKPSIDDVEITLHDTAYNDASATRHGFLKKLSGAATEFMNGTGAWSVPGVGSHVIADGSGLGASHTTSGLTAGWVLRATAATAAKFMRLVASDLSAIGARAFHNANQNVNHNTNTVLALNSERWDTDACHDNATNNSRLTCKTAGKYIITASIEFASNTTGVRTIDIRLNGSAVLVRDTRQAVNGDLTRCSTSTIYNLNLNDYVEIQAYHTAGVTLAITGNVTYSPELSMVLVGT